MKIWTDWSQGIKECDDLKFSAQGTRWNRMDPIGKSWRETEFEGWCLRGWGPCEDLSSRKLSSPTLFSHTCMGSGWKHILVLSVTHRDNSAVWNKYLHYEYQLNTERGGHSLIKIKWPYLYPCTKEELALPCRKVSPILEAAQTFSKVPRVLELCHAMW